MLIWVWSDRHVGNFLWTRYEKRHIFWIAEGIFPAILKAVFDLAQSRTRNNEFQQWLDKYQIKYEFIESKQAPVCKETALPIKAVLDDFIGKHCFT